MTCRSGRPDGFAAAGETRWSAPFALAAGEDLPFPVAIERVEAALRLGIDPSLEPVRALLAELGHPERHVRCIQVAGTNGKTSTARYTAALLGAAGLTCGLYTSPHLVSYTERVEVGGRPVGEDVFARGVSWALAAWARIAGRGDEVAALGCTEFEMLTAAALVIFAEQGVEVAVLEVGLGGRWDATSAVEPEAVAITGIGLDHTAILGDTLGAIAGEKAAIVAPGIPCVLGTNAVRPQEVLDVMLGACDRCGVVPTAVVERGDADVLPGAAGLPRASFAVTHEPAGLGDVLALDVDVEIAAGCPDGSCGTGVSASYRVVELAAPRYQAQNVACALALATAFLGEPLEEGAARAAVASCAVPGRFEVLRTEPLLLLDACHNPQSAQAFAQALVEAEPCRARRPYLLLGALSDKDHDGIVRIVAPLFERIVVTQSSSPRAYPAAELAREVRDAAGVEPLAVTSDVGEALAYLAGKPVVCCGTITLIGEVKGLYEQGKAGTAPCGADPR